MTVKVQGHSETMDCSKSIRMAEKLQKDDDRLRVPC